ncbi:hypothetical protein [Vibrio parahaemolyticus]|uniref:hypothetical protein n=1 Tax=Vibrio parahaemolyticus TaxID=670 RepID=UPI001C57793A|nr:hypothetical protein [Vibrio parahaemolyticus]
MTKPKNFGASGNVSATFTALQGQLGFTCWLPLREENQNIVPLKPEKVQGYQFDCPWVDTSGHEQSFPMGHFSACVTGSVYALAAATCQLSSKFEFGPTHIDEGFGIKGIPWGCLSRIFMRLTLSIRAHSLLQRRRKWRPKRKWP